MAAFSLPIFSWLDKDLGAREQADLENLRLQRDLLEKRIEIKLKHALSALERAQDDRKTLLGQGRKLRREIETEIEIFAEPDTDQVKMLNQIAHPEGHTCFCFDLEDESGKIHPQSSLCVNFPPIAIPDLDKIIFPNRLVGDLSIKGDAGIILLTPHVGFPEILEHDLGTGTDFFLKFQEVGVIHLLPLIRKTQRLAGGPWYFPMVILPGNRGPAFDNNSAEFAFDFKKHRPATFFTVAADAELEAVEGFPLFGVMQAKIRGVQLQRAHPVLREGSHTIFIGVDKRLNIFPYRRHQRCGNNILRLESADRQILNFPPWHAH